MEEEKAQNPVIGSGKRFRMEDGSVLAAARNRQEQAGLSGAARSGDVAFFSSRDKKNPAAVLRPAGGELPLAAVEKAAGLAASCLRGRSISYDDPAGKTFKIYIGIFPAAPSIVIEAAPVSRAFYDRRLLRPGGGGKAFRILVDEISRHVERGEAKKAEALAVEIRSFPAEYRKKAVSEIVKKFAGAVRRFEKGAGFGIPLMLSGHRALMSVLEIIRPGAAARHSEAGRPVALAASVEGDSGWMRGIVTDLLSAAGYAVVDGGDNAKAVDILKKTKKEKPSLLLLCGLMPAVFPSGGDTLRSLKACKASVRKLMKLLEEEGLRAGVEVVLAGLAFNRKFARAVSADSVYRSFNSLMRGLFERNPGKED